MNFRANHLPDSIHNRSISYYHELLTHILNKSVRSLGPSGYDIIYNIDTIAIGCTIFKKSVLENLHKLLSMYVDETPTTKKPISKRTKIKLI